MTNLNLETKTTFELKTMIADIQAELKLREMIELQAQAKEAQANVDYQTADISGGVFANPSIANNQNYACNRIEITPYLRANGKTNDYSEFEEFLDATSEVFAYEISRGDILEFVGYDGRFKDQKNINTNYILVLDINASEIEYQEFDSKDAAFEAFKAMPEGKKDKSIDELSEKELVDLAFKKDRSKDDFQSLYNRLSDITKNIYRDVFKSNGFEAA